MASEEKLPKVVEWEAYEYLHHDRSVDWFWGVGLVGMVLGLGAILLGNELLAVVIAIGFTAAVLTSVHHPEVKRYALTPRGIIENHTLYPYSELDVFWVVEENPPKLLIRSRRTLAPLLVLPIPEGADSQLIHDYLYQYIDDEPLSESSLQKFMERLGF